jgi:hypothetical protein
MDARALAVGALVALGGAARGYALDLRMAVVVSPPDGSPRQK